MHCTTMSNVNEDDAIISLITTVILILVCKVCYCKFYQIMEISGNLYNGSLSLLAQSLRLAIEIYTSTNDF